ncbi:MAG: ATPase, partial [Muribaculaceae bacterium]|nr:ATPase [Muribaculaceae bacterium]
AYTAQGAYGLLRWMPFGGRYEYSYANTGMALPGARSFEVTACYDYTNASDAAAGIWGGIAHDASCTMTYYFNRWILARLRYSYTAVCDRRVDGLLPRRHVNAIQARVQVVF